MPKDGFSQQRPIFIFTYFHCADYECPCLLSLSRRRRSNGKSKFLKTCEEEPTSSAWWTRSKTQWWVVKTGSCMRACEPCNPVMLVTQWYLLFSSVKPCVVLSLQSRTPALVFEYINNTDFKVLKFGLPAGLPSMQTRWCPLLITWITLQLLLHMCRGQLLTSEHFLYIDVSRAVHRSFTRSWQTTISVTTCMSF